MSDIAGYWPQTARPVRGPQEYAKRIIDLLDFIPDFCTRRNVMFVRWIARGTGPKGPFEAVGVDRRNVILLAAGSVRRNGRIGGHELPMPVDRVPSEVPPGLPSR